MRYFVFLLVFFSAVVFAKFAMPDPVVTTAKVFIEKRDLTYSTIGIVEAKNSATLKTEVTGIVDFVSAAGGVVNKGDVILELRHGAEAASVQEALAKLEHDEWFFNKTKKLHKSGSVSDLDLENAKKDFLISQSQVVLAQNDLSKKIIKAPFSAKVGVVVPKNGEYLIAGSKVALLQNKEVVWLSFSLPQSKANIIHVGDEIVFLSSLKKDASVLARVEAIDPFLGDDRQLNIRAIVSNVPGWLLMKSFGKVVLKLKKQVDMVIIPAVAVLSKSGSDSVFVVDKDNKAKSRIVVTGSLLANGMIEVLSGLNNSDEVVMLGGFKLYNGQKVVVKK